MPAGPTAHSFPSGSGFTAKGAFSIAANYVKGDTVLWLGSSFVAKNAVTAGTSTNPLTDTTNWQLVSSGGGELAYAENSSTGAILALSTAGTATDIPGMTINVPAGSPAHHVQARIPLVVIKGASTSLATDLVAVRMYLVDEGNVMIASWQWETVMAKAGAINLWNYGWIRSRRMASNASQKTYKLQAWLDSTNSAHQSAEFWAGPGATLPVAQGNFDFGQAFIEAIAR